MTSECLDCLQLCGISCFVCCFPQEGHREQTGEGGVEIQTFNYNHLVQKYQIGKTTLKQTKQGKEGNMALFSSCEGALRK